jgi:hypothetical protein
MWGGLYASGIEEYRTLKLIHCDLDLKQLYVIIDMVLRAKWKEEKWFGSLKQECTSIDFFFFLFQSYTAEKAYIATQGKKTKSFYYYLNVIIFLSRCNNIVISILVYDMHVCKRGHL